MSAEPDPNPYAAQGRRNVAEQMLRDGVSGQEMAVEVDRLMEFKARVDEQLRTLGASDAAPSRIGDERLQPRHLGTGFGEADSLMRTYTRIHDQLEALSRLLADQIEAMSITVHGAGNDYVNVDQEQRDRVWAIYQATARYDAAPEGPQQATAAPAAAASSAMPETQKERDSHAGGTF